MNNLWRIHHTTNDEQQDDYPPFVTRGFHTESYGGLEPSIASAIGSGLVKGLERAKAMRPTDVAYVSLHSLSLGRRPPVIRSIKLGNEIVEPGDTQQIELDLEVDALMEDLSMIFGTQRHDLLQ